LATPALTPRARKDCCDTFYSFTYGFEIAALETHEEERETQSHRAAGLPSVLAL
jgi:hypothetical protein